MKIYKTKKELIDDVVKSNDAVLDVGFWGQVTFLFEMQKARVII